MAIEIAISDEPVAVNRNRVFLSRLEIEQTPTTDDSLPPKYRVTLEYRRYGVDAQGVRHYTPEQQEIHIQDFLAHAMAEAAAGDMTQVQALQAIEGAVAAIIADDLNTTATVI